MGPAHPPPLSGLVSLSSSREPGPFLCSGARWKTQGHIRFGSRDSVINQRKQKTAQFSIMGPLRAFLGKTLTELFLLFP